MVMLRGISDLRRLTIAGADGNLGTVGDVYFDDRSWSVRYLAIEADAWFPDGRVFIPPVFVRSSDSTTLTVASSKAQVKVSSMVHTEDAHLQTATVLMGYAIEAEDGEIGHVKDLLVDDRVWAIRYLVVDTGKWWGGKTVLVSPEWLARVTWDESKTLFCLVTATDDTAGPRALSRRLAG
jgi:sporulation protein YlmC with PRC-barrel domain